MMASQQASYDELIKQVLNLQRENTDLRRELLNSSSQLRQIENDSLVIRDTVVNARLNASQTDSHTTTTTCTTTGTAAALNYDVTATGDIYSSGGALPTPMPSSDLLFLDQNHGWSTSKCCHTLLFIHCVPKKLSTCNWLCFCQTLTNLQNSFTAVLERV